MIIHTAILLVFLSSFLAEPDNEPSPMTVQLFSAIKENDLGKFVKVLPKANLRNNVSFTTNDKGELQMALIDTWMTKSPPNAEVLTPLICAVKYDRQQMLKWLLYFGAPIDIEVDNRTALFYAVANKNSAIARALIHNKADPNAGGAKPFMMAAYHGDMQMCYMLNVAGAKYTTEMKEILLESPYEMPSICLDNITPEDPPIEKGKKEEEEKKAE